MNGRKRGAEAFWRTARSTWSAW